eukprot:GILK01006833.1.p1 GENE.GILK01006833.1~~GILK01006833.1.p1  ORF type:complete len:246 (-),score=34.79 GILK01006833.1:276-983(-)
MAPFQFSDEKYSLETVRQKMSTFAAERDWNQFHTPRNLLLALVGEVGEVSELFQWKGEVPVGLEGWSAEERQNLGDELSDVLLYLVRLADRCEIDLPAAVQRKMQKNAEKYPAALVKGSSKKYNTYRDNWKRIEKKVASSPSGETTTATDSSGEESSMDDACSPPVANACKDGNSNVVAPVSISKEKSASRMDKLKLYGFVSVCFLVGLLPLLMLFLAIVNVFDAVVESETPSLM